jgi:hypothetical protein
MRSSVVTIPLLGLLALGACKRGLDPRGPLAGRADSLLEGRGVPLCRRVDDGTGSFVEDYCVTPDSLIYIRQDTAGHILGVVQAFYADSAGTQAAQAEIGQAMRAYGAPVFAGRDEHQDSIIRWRGDMVCARFHTEEYPVWYRGHPSHYFERYVRNAGGHHC